ncbi:PP2C family protein-serine/threonine phosphatase [Corynebacterium amycolatum]|uniref:PP2C family protein-serine/threonine phosphatase n=1 Tax=Corynebacterium amycolatum TaxID=43765 RepID=UPI000E1908CC|nr:PP2C family serine/threonine-protein phosphatase [Corynebacterium amycolatum]STB96626.1 protein phosphatase [Corynebacterium amycolatum]
MSLALNYTARSDRGLIRQNNEDSAYAGSRLLALADGMGGHAAGEIASQLMIAAVSRLDNDQPGPDLLESLRRACIEGNNSIADEIDQNPSTQGMGTTLTALLFDGTRLGMCHVGDSRGYLLRDGELIRITRDDTYVQSLVDEGNLTEEEAAVHPQRSLILKALTGRPVEPTLSYRDVHEGDRYLLCSDGLSDPVSADTIKDVLSEGTPDEAATKLIDYALKSGGPDNVTVVIADVVDSSARTPYEPALAGALQSADEELPRPNTAAGRAAALRPRKSQEIAVTSEPEKKASKGKWLVISVVLVLVAGLAGLGIWGWQKKESMYHLAVVDGQVQLMHGVPGSLLGFDLQEPHQFICLTDDNKVQLPPAGTPKEKVNCHIMTPEDLSPAARNSLEGLPADSYDGVSDQIGRLAESALPVCLSVSDDDKDATSADKKDEKLGSKPGVNCRQVRK